MCVCAAECACSCVDVVGRVVVCMGAVVGKVVVCVGVVVWCCWLLVVLLVSRRMS